MHLQNNLISWVKAIKNRLFILLAVSGLTLVSGCTTTATDNNQQAYPTSANRVQPIAVEDMDEQQKALIGIVDGQPLPPRAESVLFRTLMHHPDLTSVYLPMGDRVNRAEEIPYKQRELVILRAAWLYQGQYEWARHYANALDAGWTEEDIERIKIGGDAPGWSPIDQALLKSADQLINNAFIEDDVWVALQEQFSVPDIMVLITLITHYHWVAMMTKTLGVEPDMPVTAFSSSE